jgi:HSF-type DNA-binding
MCISRNASNKRPNTNTWDVMNSKTLSASSYCTSSNIRSAPFWSPEKLVLHQTHHIVSHDYHDHSNDITEVRHTAVARGGVSIAFPLRLHELLDRIEADGFDCVVSWQPHGRCFVVHDTKKFVEKVMPTYFKQSKIASFQRQLNLYGFRRLTKGDDKGGYYHELFLKGKVDLAHKIQRIKVKGTGVRARSNPNAEPNFYIMSPVNMAYGNSSVPDEITSIPPIEFPILSVMTKQDDVMMFEGRPFHYIEPYMYKTRIKSETLSEDEMALLCNFKISRGYNQILNHVDDDDEFGNLLELVIA